MARVDDVSSCGVGDKVCATVNGDGASWSARIEQVVANYIRRAGTQNVYPLSAGPALLAILIEDIVFDPIVGDSASSIPQVHRGSMILISNRIVRDDPIMRAFVLGTRIHTAVVWIASHLNAVGKAVVNNVVRDRDICSTEVNLLVLIA